MSKYVFVLGAGASAHAGVPMMAGFLDRARELYEGDIGVQWKEDFDLVFKILAELQRVHSKAELDLSNIEAVFTTFELGQTIQKLPGVQDRNFEGATKSLKMVILRTIEHTMRLRLSDVGEVRASRDYENFATLLKRLSDSHGTGWEDISVITFNYDVGLEVAFTLQDILYDYCLASTGGSAHAIRLLKLHGSTNWGKILGADKIALYPMENLLAIVRRIARQLADAGRRHVKLGFNSGFREMTEKLTGSKVEESPFFVPPGLFKTEYQGSIGRVWQQAAKELEGAEEIVVVGYSLPDTDFFFRNLFALGTVGPKFIRRFAAFNPDNSGDVKRRFCSLLGPGVRDRFDYQAMKFDEGIDKIAEWYLS